MKDFYLTLPSDSSMELYPENTLSTYRTQLSPPVVLNHEEWEVGVAAVSFPTDWYNVVEKDNKVRLRIHPLQMGVDRPAIKCISKGGLETPTCEIEPNNVKGSIEIETHLQSNTYHNLPHFLNVLNMTFHELWKCKEIREYIYRKPVRKDSNQGTDTSEEEIYQTRLKLYGQSKHKPYASFKLDSDTNLVYFSFDNQEALNFLRMLSFVSFEIEGPIVSMLGWNGLSHTLSLDQLCRKHLGEKVVAKYQPSVNIDLDMFYLYSDMVEPQRIGDIVAPILDVFNSSQGYFRPSTVHYVPIKYDRLTTIGIY